jgi:signal transduction histidine kinase
MIRRLRFPIRLKILVTSLLVITAVVSTITFTMANLFHTDKKAYIHDLTSVIALHTSKEAHSLLEGYGQRLQVFTRLMYEQEMVQKQKADLLKKLFEDFQDFVAVTLYEKGEEQVTIYDANTLDQAGLTKEDLLALRKISPLPLSLIESGKVFVQNSTVSDKLPCLTLAIAQTNPFEETPTVAAAIIRLESLLSLARRSQVFETFVLDARGRLLAHTDSSKVVQQIQMDWIPELKGLQEKKSLGTTIEYFQDGVEWVGGFATVEYGGLLAGVQIPKTAAYLTARDLLKNLMGVSLVLLALSALLSLIWSRRTTKPIEQLSRATRIVAKGEFNIHVERTSQDEIGDLADSFNQMASELNTRETALKEAQSALVHSEKMAAFGQLGAGIAHEVKNPLAGILGFAQLSLRKVKKDNPLHKNLSIIEKETKRCKTIIENLLKFARQEKLSQDRLEINPIVEDAIAIVEHQLGIHNVKVESELLPDLPPIIGNANQIQQVLMNLLINAQQAMQENPGLVKVTTARTETKQVEIRVLDNGPGIPEEIQERLFEPFFTTKSTGEGTGLGLSVTYGIIKDHKGDIRVESEVGKGTIFVITLPAVILDDKDVRLQTDGAV